MSSPDFLKRYRNNEDWPEIEEDAEEEGAFNFQYQFINSIKGQNVYRM